MKVNSFIPRGPAPIIPCGLWPSVRSEHGVGRALMSEGVERNLLHISKYNLTIIIKLEGR